MTGQLPPENGRLAELLCDRATEGLDPLQSRELEDLLRGERPIDADAMDLPAAALMVYWMRGRTVAMPVNVRNSALAHWPRSR